MSEYAEKQIGELLELMPEIMAHLYGGRVMGDPYADALFAKLDDYCWHRPACERGVACVGGKYIRPDGSGKRAAREER